MPREAVRDFCPGMRTTSGRPIRTEAELDRYCYRVAGTVGRRDGRHPRHRRPLARATAAALGIAMQRTNVLRDIDEDRANGRVYLARESIAGSAALAPGAREALLRDQIAGPTRSTTRAAPGIALLRQAAARSPPRPR